MKEILSAKSKKDGCVSKTVGRIESIMRNPEKYENQEPETTAPVTAQQPVAPVQTEDVIPLEKESQAAPKIKNMMTRIPYDLFKRLYRYKSDNLETTLQSITLTALDEYMKKKGY